VLDLERLEFRYVSAGDCCAVHLPFEGHPFTLPSGGRPIGWLKETSYVETIVTLGRGDRLYIYSDGVTKAVNPEGELYGDRVVFSIEEGRGRQLDESVILVIYDVREWCAELRPQDDISVLAVEVCR
jgi:sigma-B regulation protein RsbU (phosphoserine phosphatase)